MHRPPKLLYDNIYAMYSCFNLVLYSHIKSISLDYHFILEQVQAGKLCVSHVSTKDQLVDILTKLLTIAKFQDLIFKKKVP